MSEPGNRRGRVHDAQGAREAILNAAEQVFAEHGFDGARMDMIAELAGYNKSLVFQYFGDKLGLYTEVTRRADQELNKLQLHLLGPMHAYETFASDPQKFQALLKTIVGTLFDYLAERPRLCRQLLWEQAEGWQTYIKILPTFSTEDVESFETLFLAARENGLLRSDFSPLAQLMMVTQLCTSYLAGIPLFQAVRPGEDFSSAEALANARTYLINFVVAGMMSDCKDGHMTD